MNFIYFHVVTVIHHISYLPSWTDNTPSLDDMKKSK